MPIIVDLPDADGYRSYSGNPAGTSLQDVSALLGDLILGAVDERGVDVNLTDITGWWSGAGTSGEVVQRVGADGGWSNRPYRAPRHIELIVEPVGIDFNHLTPSIEAIVAAVPLVQDTLVIGDTNALLQATVQQDGEILVDRSTFPNQAKITIPLVAPDPRRYSVDMVTASTGLPQATGGLSLPLSLPLSVDATTGAGVFTATNEGTVDTPPTFTVQGPCPPFTIAHRTSGASLSFAEAVADGRTLTIDTARRLALIDGTATRTVTGTWFAYAPGDNEVAFSADSYDAGAVLTSVHRHAYL